MDAKTQQQYAETFHGLHRKGDPLILFNAWDVATAEAIAKASPAVATSSAAVASALGYADGEDVPLDTVTGLVTRMTAAVSVPVSIDLEAGYGDTPAAAAASVTEILKAGAIGINIEDGLSGGKRQLVSPDQHAAKIKAVRETAQKLGIRLFINARTDPFLLKFGSPDECLNEAAKRAKAYADAGADGIIQHEFAPRSFGLLVGLNATVGTLIMAAGPALFGLAHDLRSAGPRASRRD